MVSDTADVVAAVNKAVAAGKRVVVRSGGHCFEDFTASSDVEVLIDMSEMNAVYFDDERRVFVVQPGSTLGNVYTVLFKKWGVTIPAGECTEVGAGGHLAGGGYGQLRDRAGRRLARHQLREPFDHFRADRPADFSDPVSCRQYQTAHRRGSSS